MPGVMLIRTEDEIAELVTDGDMQSLVVRRVLYKPIIIDDDGNPLLDVLEVIGEDPDRCFIISAWGTLNSDLVFGVQCAFLSLSGPPCTSMERLVLLHGEAFRTRSVASSKLCVNGCAHS